MKAYIRTLNIKERKGFISSICYSFFTPFQLITVRILSSSLDYFTVTALTGAIINVLCCYRVVMTLEKLSRRNASDFKLIFNAGVFSFFGFALDNLSVYFTSVSNIIMLSRLFPFMVLMTENIVNDFELTSSEVNCMIVSVIIVLGIMLRFVDSIQFFGFICALAGMAMKTIAITLWKSAKGISVDIVMMSIGVLSCIFGGTGMMIKNSSMRKIGLKWFIVVINAICSYYSRIFVLKIVKNTRNMDKVIVMNLLAVLMCFIVDYFCFEVKFDFFYLVLCIVVINSIFFTISVLKKAQSNKK